MSGVVDYGLVMNLPVPRCKWQTRRKVGAQSLRGSLPGAGRATTGVDRRQLDSRDGALAQTIRTIGGT